MAPLIPIISALTTIAPSIAQWIGGNKAEDAAQAITDIARKVTGINDAQGAVNQVITDPEKQLEFMKAMDANRIAMDKLYLADIQDARNQHKHSIMPALICCVLTVAMIGFGAALMSFEIPIDNIRLIDTLFGSVITAWLGAINYWVGTTRGSAEKQRQFTAK